MTSWESGLSLAEQSSVRRHCNLHSLQSEHLGGPSVTVGRAAPGSASL